MKKRGFLLSLLLICVLIHSNLAAAAMLQPPADFYCLDQAGILAESTEKAIAENGRTLQAQSGAQIVVVTVATLEDVPISEYALQLFRDWGIGDKNKNNGVLVLVALKERRTRIEVGYGLEGRLPDGKTGRILDEKLLPNFAKGNYDAGIISTYNALLEEVNQEYGLSIKRIEQGKTGASPVRNTRTASWTQIIGIIFFLIISIFLARHGIFIWGPFGGGGFGGGGGGFGGGGSGGGGGSERDW